MTRVIDASVVIKWLFNDPLREDDTERATELMAAVVRREVEVVQPPHWLIEVAAVIARETPEQAHRDIILLDALSLPVQCDSATLTRASALAIELDHHLFDTLYHAVALEADARLITADERYHRKVKDRPEILHLRDWRA